MLSGFFTPTANRIVTEFTSFLSADFPLFFMIPSLEVQDFKKDSSRETAQHQPRLMSEHHGTISKSWGIPGTAESGGLPSMGSHRVGHD